MEPMLFFFLIILFWIPSVILLIVGLLSFKSKQPRKKILILSLIAFSIPWLLMLGTRISEKIEAFNIAGTYFGKDIKSNSIRLEIKRDNEFHVFVDNCNEVNISGSWDYDNEYGFTFYSENNEISIDENDMGGLILNSNILTNCCNLKEVKLIKK